MEEIICKWWSDELQIGVTESKTVYLLKCGLIIELNPTYHMGRLHYRIPKTSKRISDLQINKSVRVANKVLQDYCPF